MKRPESLAVQFLRQFIILSILPTLEGSEFMDKQDLNTWKNMPALRVWVKAQAIFVPCRTPPIRFR